MKVEAIKHADVKGKEMLYLKLTSKNNDIIVINVGQKTFDGVQKLITDETAELKPEPMGKKEQPLEDKRTKR